MKNYFGMVLVAAVAVVSAGAANADVVIVGVNGSFSAGGTTQDVSISGTNLRPGGSATSIPQRWDATQSLGISGGVYEGTFGGTDPNTDDWNVLIGDSNGARQLNAPVGGATGFNYAEIFFSIDSDVVLNSNGTGHRFSVNGNTPGEAFSAAQQALIPTTAGSHSFVIDLNQLSQAGSEIDFIRWDPWNVNVAANRGTDFTISQITFGTDIVAIPEPSSLAVLAIAGAGIVARRRQRDA